MSYRRLRVKDLPKVPTWRLEWDSNQRPSAPNTATEPTPPYVTHLHKTSRKSEYQVSEKLARNLMIGIFFDYYIITDPNFDICVFDTENTNVRIKETFKGTISFIHSFQAFI